MTIKYIAYLIVTISIFPGCIKDLAVNKAEEELVGKWRYDEARFQKRWTVNRKNIIQDYENLVLEFRSDYSLLATNTATGEEFTGAWKLDREMRHNYNTSDDNRRQPVTILVGSITSKTTNKTVLLDWEKVDINRKRLRATEEKDQGIYTYTLRRY